ncbi:MAG: hypothetical protein FJZ96_14870, partial [Chloroflexi bacterium]|nr:hypothetical protein [Chloroflexota bacterium]
MKPRLKSLSWITLALVLFAMLAVPMPALAALGISSVSPDPVVNHIVNVLTVSGSDFDPTAEVSVGGTPLATTFVDSATLTAVLPAGFLPGVYTVTVTNPGPVTFDLPSGLTVLAPTPTPSPTPTPTVTPLPFSRPQMVVLSYYMSTAGVRYGQEFNTSIRLYNAGYARAYGVQVTFTSVDLLMLRNGGLIAVGNLESGGAMDLTQFMTAASLAGRSMVSADMNVSYYDGQGVSYTDKFTLNFPVASTGGSTVVTT